MHAIEKMITSLAVIYKPEREFVCVAVGDIGCDGK